MRDLVDRLAQAPTLEETRSLLTRIVESARRTRPPAPTGRAFIEALVSNPNLHETLETGAAIDALLGLLPADEWDTLFGAAAAEALPGLLSGLIEHRVDAYLPAVLRLLPEGRKPGNRDGSNDPNYSDNDEQFDQRKTS